MKKKKDMDEDACLDAIDFDRVMSVAPRYFTREILQDAVRSIVRQLNESADVIMVSSHGFVGCRLSPTFCRVSYDITAYHNGVIE